MDAELKEYLDTIREEIVTIKHDMKEDNKHLETLINVTRQTLQTEMKHMEENLREAIKYRKEDENLAFQQISNITARINQLEKQVEALKAHSG